MQEIIEIKEVLQLLKDKIVLKDIQSNRFIYKKKRIYVYSSNSSYNLNEEDFLSLFKDSKFIIEDFEEEVTYHIVGTSENDPLNGLISNVSPLGVAVLGHKAGETVEVSTPDGISKFKILEII